MCGDLLLPWQTSISCFSKEKTLRQLAAKAAKNIISSIACKSKMTFSIGSKLVNSFYGLERNDKSTKIKQYSGPSMSVHFPIHHLLFNTTISASVVLMSLVSRVIYGTFFSFSSISLPIRLLVRSSQSSSLSVLCLIYLTFGNELSAHDWNQMRQPKGPEQET